MAPPDVLDKWRALGPTTWAPVDRDSPDSALEFLRRNLAECPYRSEYRTEYQAAVALLAAVWTELQERRCHAHAE